MNIVDALTIFPIFIHRLKTICTFDIEETTILEKLSYSLITKTKTMKKDFVF